MLDAWLIASGGGGNNNSGGGGGPSVTFTFDVLTVVLLLSSVLYGFCFILAKRRLSVLHRIHPEMGTKKLLVLSVALVCLVRIMTFIGVAAMNIANVRAHYTLKPDTDTHNGGDNEDTLHQAFYDDAMTVLFDLPNCIVVSTYVLLTLVWAECFVQSRFHNEDVSKWRIRCLGAYTVFNSFLYATQMILYILVFVSNSANTFRTILYAAMTGINFVSVSLVAALYIFLKRHFSGFPLRSMNAKKSLLKISNVMALWSLSRLLFGAAMLLVFTQNIELLQDSNTPVWSFFVLFLLFFGCEILPIVAMLDYSYMNMIGFEESSRGGGGEGSPAIDQSDSIGHHNMMTNHSSSHDAVNVMEPLLKSM
eukprot:CAMPEP_0198282012 /NCGR_PEP_ID=MMETSP1449-20131203/1888_1 /TAXON_ID=420275 /ORGANISM="Attheya septentrionalis, Strain CCMP2084" /LENGTH=363 /DNA_ID=CAMNT_0043978081 /DNA_START=236 /DNA_END=1327 /DNA_ORIENTATION=+